MTLFEAPQVTSHGTERPMMEKVPAPLQEALRLRTDRDIHQAIDASSRHARESFWAGLPEFIPASRAMNEGRIVTADRSDDAHAAFDLIRTKMLQALRQNGWHTVAITSPTPGCGKSLVAANLAFSLANQKDCRTLLIDLDLKEPQIGQLLRMKNLPSMEGFLQGEIDAAHILRRYGDNLAIAPNGYPVQYSAELLQSLEATRVIQSLQKTMNPDVVLFDMTSMLLADDVTAFLPNVDCSILVVAAEQSTFNEVDSCERELAERSNFLGVVLNKCRYDTF